MNWKDARIMFFGTPDFAVSSLKALVEGGCMVVGVVTAPGKPAGRGLTLKQSAVYEYALAQNLPILQPERLKRVDFLNELRAFKADLFIVVAFRMLPEVVWNMPPLGTVNVHASLLPDYRGAAPINHVLINGEQKSGVTTFLLQHEIDTGHILLQDEVELTNDMNAGQLHDILAEKGAHLLVRTVKELVEGNLQPEPQKHADANRHAPKLHREFLQINPAQSAKKTHDHIRGLSPYPAAFTQLDGKNLKVLKAEIGETKEASIAAGSWETDGKTYLRLATDDCWINILYLQPEGKKAMDVTSFLRGYRGALISK